MSKSKQKCLELNRFQMHKMPKNSRIAIIGRPGTGKSTLIFDILYNHRDIPMGIVMSGTEESNQSYSKCIPDTFIYGNYEQDKIDSVVKRQVKIRSRESKEENATGKEVEKSYVFMVLDDCMDDKKWIKNTTIRGMFKNGRHWNILFLVAMQYSLDIPPELRMCFDYVFILKENINSNKKKLYDHYCGIFPSLDMFSQVLDNCTNDYSCIVINNKSISNDIKDVVYWYKADHDKIKNGFRIGCDAFWNYHKNNYNSKYEDNEEEDTQKNYHRGGKKKMIIKKQY